MFLIETKSAKIVSFELWVGLEEVFESSGSTVMIISYSSVRISNIYLYNFKFIFHSKIYPFTLQCM